MAGLARMAEATRPDEGEGGRREDTGQGQAQAGRGRAGQLCQSALTRRSSAWLIRRNAKRWRPCNGERRWNYPITARNFWPIPMRFICRLSQIANGQVHVAELGGRVAGFAAVVGGELDGLFVEPDLWRRGIGAALVDAATHEARRRGLALTVIANPTARGFYESCGFSHEGEAQTRFGPGLRMSR